MSKNGLGIGALVCGILGFCCWGILPVVAIILGAIGISKDDEPGMAKAGLILGIISLIISILLAVFLWSFVLTLLGMGEFTLPF